MNCPINDVHLYLCRFRGFPNVDLFCRLTRRVINSRYTYAAGANGAEEWQFPSLIFRALDLFYWIIREPVGGRNAELNSLKS